MTLQASLLGEAASYAYDFVSFAYCWKQYKNKHEPETKRVKRRKIWYQGELPTPPQADVGGGSCTKCGWESSGLPGPTPD